ETAACCARRPAALRWQWSWETSEESVRRYAKGSIARAHPTAAAFRSRDSRLRCRRFSRYALARLLCVGVRSLVFAGRLRGRRCDLAGQRVLELLDARTARL